MIHEKNSHRKWFGLWILTVLKVFLIEIGITMFAGVKACSYIRTLQVNGTFANIALDGIGSSLFFRQFFQANDAETIVF